MCRRAEGSHPADPASDEVKDASAGAIPDAPDLALGVAVPVA